VLLYAFGVEAAAAIAALPVAALVLWMLLRAPAAGRLVAVPSGERWHERPTPTFGGVGIFAGLAAGLLAAVASGAVEPSSELAGIAGGAAILFIAGLVDDLWSLRPVVKLAAQLAAAGVAVAGGLTVELVGNDVLATVVALVWLVGITNAFNLLDNMDGLAATLAAIACGYFAIAAATASPANELVVTASLALGAACLGFLPFNLRPGERAAVFMGDSGSQVIGFTLAALALASSWTVAGTTVATILLPLLVLAIPILDTTLVTIVRLVERRPVTRGGKDHASHRLVYYGLSEGKAVALLALIAVALGATAVAYNILDNARITAVGVLVTFAILVQFASFLSDLEERQRSGEVGPEPSLLQALFSQPRRLAEILVDFVLICAAFLASYVLVVGGGGSEWQRGTFLAALPILLGLSYLAFTALGVYRRVWRFAGPADLAAIAIGSVLAAAATLGVLVAIRPLNDFPWQVFVLDAVLCAVLVAGSRVLFRAAASARARRRAEARTRVLVVGAGRFGRSVARELQETPGTRVVGFLDDNPDVRRRRVRGVTVLGGTHEADRAIARTRPDEILITIPDAPPERIGRVVEAAREAGVPCRLVRRQTEVPATLVETNVS
jgi:UDP-GlcNAc:undecaprenyl-phosphate GlcNAc-1-phosphate transferase